MQDEHLTRREREKNRQRNALFDAALKLFSDQGFHNVSMLEIAEEAEYSVGTLYKFFENKEDLYKALILKKAAEYRNILQQTLSLESDIMTVLDDFITAKSEFIADGDSSILRLLFAESRGASFNIQAGLDQDIREINEQTMQRLASIMEKGIQQGVFRDIDPYLMAVALEELLNGFLLHWIEEPGRQSQKERVRVVKDIFLKGVLKE